MNQTQILLLFCGLSFFGLAAWLYRVKRLPRSNRLQRPTLHQKEDLQRQSTVLKEHAASQQ